MQSVAIRSVQLSEVREGQVPTLGKQIRSRFERSHRLSANRVVAVLRPCSRDLWELLRAGSRTSQVILCQAVAQGFKALLR